MSDRDPRVDPRPGDVVEVGDQVWDMHVVVEIAGDMVVTRTRLGQRCECPLDVWRATQRHTAVIWIAPQYGELEARIAELERDNDRMWRWLNRERGRLIDAHMSGLTLPEDRKRLSELQELADKHLDVAAPRPEPPIIDAAMTRSGSPDTPTGVISTKERTTLE